MDIRKTVAIENKDFEVALTEAIALLDCKKENTTITINAVFNNKGVINIRVAINESVKRRSSVKSQLLNTD